MPLPSQKDRQNDMAEDEKRAISINPTVAQIERSTLLRSEYWSDNSLKDNPGFRKLVNDFFESVDKEIIIRTILHANEHLEGTPTRVFTEEFIAPYALEKGLVEKKRGKFKEINDLI
jgi:hypothetical protein